MRPDDFVQTWILLCSAAAIFLVTSRRPRWRRFGCILGLLGQPAWIISSMRGGQWGVLLLSCWFVFSYTRALWYAIGDLGEAGAVSRL